MSIWARCYSADAPFYGNLNDLRLAEEIECEDIISRLEQCIADKDRKRCRLALAGKYVYEAAGRMYVCISCRPPAWPMSVIFAVKYY